MYDLFDTPLDGSIRRITYPNYEYVLKRQKGNLDKVIYFYRNQNHAVKSSHFLVRLLQSIPSGNGMELREYVDRIGDYTRDFASSFGMSSPTSYGRTYEQGVIIGEGNEEVLIASNERFSPTVFKSKWEDAEPIVFLAHAKSDLSLNPLWGEDYSDEKGFAVIKVNVPMLAAQYRLWKARELEMNPDDPKSIMQFIFAYPLTNALKSFQEIAYFNRFYNLFNAKKNSPKVDNHPFYLVDYSDRIDKGMGILLDRYLNRRIPFREVLEGFPGISNEFLMEALETPKMAQTRQVTWGLNLAKVKVISLFLLWNSRSNSRSNRQLMNQLRRSIKRLKSDKMMNVAMSNRLSKEFKRFMEEEIEYYL